MVRIESRAPMIVYREMIDQLFSDRKRSVGVSRLHRECGSPSVDLPCTLLERTRPTS